MRGGKGKARKSGKLVHGVGINDADYPVCPRENGQIVWCKFYRVWSSMLYRCYSSKKEVNSPSYVDVTVHDSWLRFSVFKAWMEVQKWEGLELDKDLLVPGNKLYGPDTCYFIPQNVNSFMTDSRKARGEYPLGVCYYKNINKFGSHCHGGDKLHYLGVYDTPEEAHAAYKVHKAKLAIALAEQQSDPVIAKALISRYVEGVL